MRNPNIHQYQEPNEPNPEEKYSETVLRAIRYEILLKKFGEEFLEAHDDLTTRKFLEERGMDPNTRDQAQILIASVFSMDEDILEELADYKKKLNGLTNARDLVAFAKAEGLTFTQEDKENIADTTGEMISKDLW